MKAAALIGLTIIGLSPAFAEDPVGCDKFKFSVEAEKAALTAPMPSLASGSDAKLSAAETISLRPLEDAQIPKPPERAQKPGTFAGFVNLPSVTAGTYNIVISDYGWVDAVQNGAYLKPIDHSGVKGCAAARKAMKFQFTGGPATIQLSGVTGNSIKLAVFPSR